jgi:hypothetical protein
VAITLTSNPAASKVVSGSRFIKAERVGGQHQCVHSEVWDGCDEGASPNEDTQKATSKSESSPILPILLLEGGLIIAHYFSIGIAQIPDFKSRQGRLNTPILWE